MSNSGSVLKYKWVATSRPEQVMEVKLCAFVTFQDFERFRFCLNLHTSSIYITRSPGRGNTKTLSTFLRSPAKVITQYLTRRGACRVPSVFLWSSIIGVVFKELLHVFDYRQGNQLTIEQVCKLLVRSTQMFRCRFVEEIIKLSFIKRITFMLMTHLKPMDESVYKLQCFNMLRCATNTFVFEVVFTNYHYV